MCTRVRKNVENCAPLIFCKQRTEKEEKMIAKEKAYEIIYLALSKGIN